MSVLSDFNTAIDNVTGKVIGNGSIYQKTLTELNTLYTSFGMSVDSKNKIIAEVSAQLAISTTSKAIDAAVVIAKAEPIIAAQVAEINARAATEAKKTLQVARQTTAFSDKLKVEVMKTFAGIASMEATNTGTSTDTLTSLNTKITNVESAAI